tara:strand:+ start:464 stop:1510 length:1047 start_codon:yes stop_codon:yes gene_type:complete
MNKILIFNIATDSDDTSLGFAVSWLNSLSKSYDVVDVVTLKKGNTSLLNRNINVFEIKKNNVSIIRIFKAVNLIKKLLVKDKYSYCLSHMSPILSIISYFQLKRKNIPSVLWYAHPGPKDIRKKIILYISKFTVDKIITSTSNSYPLKSKKINAIGQAINYDYFFIEKKEYDNENFLILSRISKSKKIDESINAFLNSIYSKSNSIYVIGGPVTVSDKKYYLFLKNKYKNFDNVIFKGSIPHNQLKKYFQDTKFHINNTTKGNYDKTVLETSLSGIINFYKNSDYDKFFPNKYINYLRFENNTDDLLNKISMINELNDADLSKIIKSSQIEIQKETLETLDQRIKSIL